VSDLTDFVEAPGRFMEPSEGAFVVKTPRFVALGRDRAARHGLRQLEDVLSVP
jgi:hypothetical protein